MQMEMVLPRGLLTKVTCGSLPWKSKVSSSPLTVMSTRTHTGLSVMPSQSPADSPW